MQPEIRLLCPGVSVINDEIFVMKDRRILLLTNILLFFVLGLLPLGMTPGPEEPAPFPTATHNPFAEPIKADIQTYAWPTDASTIITSTFGEYRNSHFHGGIDISTNDKTGYKVFAAQDGYVSRITVSPTGYGKVLYVRHPDGYTTLYAHLGRFAGAVETRTRQEQQRQERFTVDFTCTPDELPVSKGDVIAYTGDTGVGTSHLHFEVRDEKMDGINPLLGKSDLVEDEIAPGIKRIAVTPLDEFARVQGGWHPQIYVAHETGKDVYRIRETIPITGHAGFSINARDYNGRTGYSQGVYAYQLLLDDQIVSSVVFNRAPQNEIQRIGQYYDWTLQDDGQGRFERLYVDSTSILPFFVPPTPGTGVVNSEAFAEGPHTFRIVCRDIAGNTSEVSGNLIFNHPPAFNVEPEQNRLRLTFADINKVAWIHYSTKYNNSSTWLTRTISPSAVPGTAAVEIPEPTNGDVVRLVAENAYGTRSRPQFVFLRKPVGTGKTLSIEPEIHDDYIRLLLKTNGVFTATPIVTVDEGGATRTVPMTPVDIDLYEGAFRPLATVAGTRRISAQAEVHSQILSTVTGLELFPVVPGQRGNYAFDNGRLTVSYDTTSVYKTLFLQMAKKVEDGHMMYSLLPEHAILHDGIKVQVKADPLEVPQGLYFQGRGGLDLIDVQKTAGEGSLRGRLSRTLGDLAVLTDVTGPFVSRLSVSRGRQPMVRFSYGDNLSGIEYRELKTYIDQKCVIPEIDGEHHRAYIRIDEPLGRGSHQLTIRLKDRAGNTSVVERRFTVR